MKKSTLFLLPLLAAAGLNAQLNLPPTTSNNSNFSYYSPQTINTGNPTDLTVGTNPSSNYNYLSAQAIHFPPAFHAGATSGSTGKFHAYLLNQQLPAALLEPSDPNNVPRFSKVEFGVNLSGIAGLNFDTRVNTFLNGNYKPGTSAYNQDYNNRSILNPYDPEHISVDAVFFRPGNPNMDGLVRYGFYYKPFVENATNTSWNTVPTIYEWRIRFAPDEIGTWNGFINIYVDGGRLMETYAFTFKVIASDNPGNVVIDNAHPRYLKFSADNSTYFPIGINYAWPWNNDSPSNRANQLAPYGFAADWRITANVVPEMRGFFDSLTNYPNGNGGNTTRIIMAPWGFQIEREKLGNYETRQIEMSEMDSIVSMMEARSVYCILSFNIHDEFHVRSNYNSQTWTYSDGWHWHPYRENVVDQSVHDPFVSYKGIAGVEDVIDFYTNPVAKAFFKKRLRYIVSRWGYSTSISMYELLTEIDQFHQEVYWDTLTIPSPFATAVADWHDEMYDYIRNELHDPHIRTGTFTGSSFNAGDDGRPAHDVNGMLLWNKPNIDLISRHSYGVREIANRWEAGQTQLAQANFSKPLYANECDVSTYVMCSQASDWGIHNKQWVTALSGNCGAGLPWYWDYFYRWENFQYNDPWGYGGLNEYVGEYERNYVALNAFISNIDFRNYDYAPYHSCFDVTGNPIAYETFYLLRDDGKAAYGWTHNRSFNHFTVIHFQNTLDPGNVTSVAAVTAPPYFNPGSCTTSTNCAGIYDFWGFNSPQYGVLNDNNYTGLFGSSYAPQARASGYFYIDNLLPNTNYKVEWYWTWGQDGGQNTGSPSFYMTDANGRLIVSNAPPTGYVSGVNYPGDWAFIVSKVELRLAGPNIAPATFGIVAFPNPSTGTFTLRSDLSETPATIEVRALDGRLVLRKEVARLDGHTLDLGEQPDGVYLLDVTRNGQTNHLKLVKTQ